MCRENLPALLRRLSQDPQVVTWSLLPTFVSGMLPKPMEKNISDLFLGAQSNINNGIRTKIGYFSFLFPSFDRNTMLWLKVFWRSN